MNQEEYDAYQAQSALQSQIAEQTRVLYAPQLREAAQQNQAVLVEQTNPRKVVRDICLYLQGREEENGRVVQWGEAKMNDVGISHVKFILMSLVNQGTILSHIEKPYQISKMMDQVSNDFVDDLSINWKYYGIKNKTDLDIINDVVLIAIYMALNRALGQNEKNWLSRTTVESISGGAAKLPHPRDGGWLSKFKL